MVTVTRLLCDCTIQIFVKTWHFPRVGYSLEVALVVTWWIYPLKQSQHRVIIHSFFPFPFFTLLLSSFVDFVLHHSFLPSSSPGSGLRPKKVAVLICGFQREIWKNRFVSRKAHWLIDHWNHQLSSSQFSSSWTVFELLQCVNYVCPFLKTIRAISGTQTVPN